MSRNIFQLSNPRWLIAVVVAGISGAVHFSNAAELADRHYRLGTVPIATYVELQKQYLEAVEALLDTRREALEAGQELQRLTGLDFDAVRVAQPTGEKK